jgi:outer membrane protein, multidrug efflux system
MIMFSRHRIGLAVIYLLGAAALNGCSISSVKNSKELTKQSLPNTAIPKKFQAQSAINKNSIRVDDAWLKQFNDAELDELVAEALKNNPDMQVMAARRMQSQTVIDAATGAQYPGVNAFGNAGGNVGASGTGLTGYYIGANWELDLWGRVRSSIAGAEQNAKALNAQQDAARLSLIATLTKAVWLARGLQEQAILATENSNAANQYLALLEIRNRVGASSVNEVANARISAAQSKELALNLTQSRDQSLRSIAILVGRYPKAEKLKTTTLPTMPDPVAPGMPAELLERRPDIIAAEAKVNSAFYAADEKRLARLPKISLTAGYGLINSNVFSLVNGGSGGNLGVGANVLLPIFQGGAIEAQIAYQNAEAKAALANYGKVILNAFNEVENALNGEATWRERSIQLEIQLQEQKRVLSNTKSELKIGRIDQRQLQQQIIKTNTTAMNQKQGQVDALTQRVNLYLALGGSAD